MTPEQKLAELLWDVNHGYPMFPCGPDKKPLTEHGCK
jgi:hypothetical protein